ncbi:MAG: EamA family transporter [Flammeovirgaceae bacterium]|nr:MAG: EamA family transporter [Flammeovirgaceae bacterium]
MIAEVKTRPNYLPYAALVAVSFIWGTTYLALRIGVLNFPPFLFTAIRQVSAGMILMALIAGFKRVPWPPASHVLQQAIAGFFLITMGNGLVAWSEVHIPSGVAAILCSLMPVAVILINMTIGRDEKPNLTIGLGAILGLGGILLMFSEHVAEFSKTEYLLGILLTLGAVLSWAFGSIWIKRHHSNSNPFVNAALQMFFGGLFCLPISFAVDDLTTVSWSPEAVYTLLYLIIFGSIVAYASYLYALRSLPMTIVSLYAYVNPLVAVILGWMVLNEKLNGTIGLAIAVTIAGIYLVNRGYQLRTIWKAQFSKS